MKREHSITGYGVVIGLIMLAAQHGFYLLGHTLAQVVGFTALSPKIAVIDEIVPLVPLFIFPYIWSYIYWAMGPMIVSKCDKKYFCDFVAAYAFTCLVGMVILIFVPTYMDRVAEGLMADNVNGFGAPLMKFWYSLDGSDMAYNLLPSFHCSNSTVCLLGVWGKKEIPKAYQWYSLILTVLIYASTMFVKQHFFLDVLAGIALALICYPIAMRFRFGRIFYPLAFRAKKEQ